MLKFSLQLINCIAVKLKTFFGDLAANAFSPKMNFSIVFKGWYSSVKINSCYRVCESFFRDLSNSLVSVTVRSNF